MRTPTVASQNGHVALSTGTSTRLARSLRQLSTTQRLWASVRKQLVQQKRAAKAADIDEIKDLAQTLSTLDSIIDAADALVDSIQEDLAEVIQEVDPSWTPPPDEDDDDEPDDDGDIQERAQPTTAPPRARMPVPKPRRATLDDD